LNKNYTQTKYSLHPPWGRPEGERGVFTPSICAMEWLWNRYPVGIITGADPGPHTYSSHWQL